MLTSSKRGLGIAAGAVILYTAAFYAAPLTGVSEILGQPLRRGQVFQYLFIPDEIIRSWFGNGGSWSLADRLPPFAVACAVIMTAWAAGDLAMRLVGVGSLCGRKERLVLATAVGLNLYSTAVLILGLFGLIGSRTPLFLLSAGIWFVALAFRARGWKGIGGKKGVAKPVEEPQVAEHPTYWGGNWLLGPVIVGLLILLLGVLPPVDFDVREYHLQAPKEFYQAGKIDFLPHNVYANMPLGVEMQALGAMALSRDVLTGALAGKIVIAFFGLILIAAVYVVADKWGGKSRAIASSLVVASTPWVIQVSAAGLNDVAFAVYCFLAFYAMTHAWEQLGHSPPAPRAHNVGLPRSLSIPRAALAWLALAGYLAGAAASCKYTGLIYSLAPLTALLWMRSPLWRNRQAMMASVVFFAGIGLGGGAWYVKNAVLCGNPTYPLLYRFFDGEGWDEQKNDRWTRVHSPPDDSPSSLVRDVGRVTLTSDWLGPLLWPFALVSLTFRGEKNASYKYLWVMIAWLLFAWWSLTHRIDRFWLPLIPFVAVAAGDGLHLMADSRRWRWVGYAAVVPALFLNVLISSAGICSYNRILAPLRELWDDPNRIGEVHLMLNRMWPNQFSGRLLAVGDAAVFDLQMPVLYATCFDDQPWDTLTRNRSPREIHAALRQAGIGCVFVNWAEIARYRSPGNYGFTGEAKPEQFHNLVRARVLIPVLMPRRSPGEVFQVNTDYDKRATDERRRER